MSGRSAKRHVAVIGGGIAGLSAVHALLNDEGGSEPPTRVTLLEAQERLGGKICSEPIGPETLDVGAESLMARAPAAIALCEQLGLEQELVAAADTSSRVWLDGRLAPLPSGILAGAPGSPTEVLRSRILSPAGVARAALDLLLPACDWRADESVGEIVTRRLGAQALERLVDPLLGTIYGTDCERLSAAATAPQLSRLSREHRSLIRGMLGAGAPARGASTQQGPLFVTLPGGLERLALRLAERARAADIRLGTPARAIERRADGGYLVSAGDAEPLQVDAVIIATPAPQAAALLSGIAPAAATELEAIRYASTVIVTLRYPRTAALSALRCAGLLVPRNAGKLLGACTFLSVKWPHLAAGGDAWLRCSVARSRTAYALEAGDGDLVRALAKELERTIGAPTSPKEAHVKRWQRSLPLYEPGHIARIKRIEQEVASLGGVALAGAAYHGIGVPQCIADGEAAAHRLLSELRDHELGTPAGVPS